jgi:hypothetical protein
LFIGTQFSNLYTAVDTPAMGRVVVCLCLFGPGTISHSRVCPPAVGDDGRGVVLEQMNKKKRVAVCLRAWSHQ